MYLVQHKDPSRIKANIHMDMAGGGPVTKAVFDPKVCPPSSAT
jgi:hypothetical protein